MSVEPEASGPTWPVPPKGGWTADDLDRLPNLPPHTELIDGSLVFVSPQTIFHESAVDFFKWQLRSLAPRGLVVRREMTVVIDSRNRPEPDVVVLRRGAVTGPGQTQFDADDVILAIEVVSPDSELRDREVKPRKYAKAGVPHFWRVENDHGRPVVYVFELEPVSRQYAPTGIFHEDLKVSVPFPIALDLAEIMRDIEGPESLEAE
ncbi:Uma2 family endonuclease [Streptomyces sp. PA5.6]|uniref:Uma2 family endonuclease n=1 Tax=Streptomyces sp. PA5.6 TaxID=3035651 RepID=UPI00390494D0